MNFQLHQQDFPTSKHRLYLPLLKWNCCVIQTWKITGTFFELSDNRCLWREYGVYSICAYCNVVASIKTSKSPWPVLNYRNYHILHNWPSHSFQTKYKNWTKLDILMTQIHQVRHPCEANSIDLTFQLPVSSLWYWRLKLVLFSTCYSRRLWKQAEAPYFVLIKPTRSFRKVHASSSCNYLMWERV